MSEQIPTFPEERTDSARGAGTQVCGLAGLPAKETGKIVFFFF